MPIINILLFLMCVVLFIMGSISLLVGAWPMTIILSAIFYICYKAMRYDGPQPKQIHLTFFDGNKQLTVIDDDDYEPFNRDNFNLN